MNKGYAFGFLVVLLIVVLGMYVAISGFRSARDAGLAQVTAEPVDQSVQATRLPTRLPATPTPTLFLIPTPLPALTATVAPEPTAPSETAPEPPPPTALPDYTPLPAPTQPPQPPPTPQPAFQFRVLSTRPDASRGGCCYIFGTVRDAQGNPLEGVLVRASNQWSSLPPASTKGGADLGKYDIPIGTDKVTWYVAIVDAAGNRISTEAVVEFDVGIAGQFQVDWQRTY